MWLAIDAAGPGVTAWPVGADGSPGDPIEAETPEAALAMLAARGLRPDLVMLDAVAEVRTLPCPVAPADLAAALERRTIASLSCLLVPALAGAEGVTVGGLARVVGALQSMRGKVDPKRPLLICDCRANGTAAWFHVTDGCVARIAFATTGESLAGMLRRDELAQLEAGDEDDDLAFERGLGLAEDAQDLGADLEKASRLARDGHVRGGAIGAMIAGVLVGHDAARGLRLGRLGGPLVLIGSGLMADRYAIALGRFGVAMRRMAPLAPLLDGCAALAGGLPRG